MEKIKIDTVVLLGKTGSGKGTQAKFISERLGHIPFSTGDRFREIRLQNTPLGRKVKEHYDQGLLMPHWLATFVFQEEMLNLEDGEEIVFEGTGRTLEESKLFDEVCQWLGREYVIFHLNVSDEEVVRRMQERKRDVLDTSEKIKKRLEEYRLHTAKAIEFFRDKEKFIEINGENTPEEVYKEILVHLKK